MVDNMKLRVYGLNASGYCTLFVQNTGRSTACIMFKIQIDAFLFPRYSERDIATMIIELKSKGIQISTSYPVSTTVDCTGLVQGFWTVC